MSWTVIFIRRLLNESILQLIARRGLIRKFVYKCWMLLVHSPQCSNIRNIFVTKFWKELLSSLLYFCTSSPLIQIRLLSPRVKREEMKKRGKKKGISLLPSWCYFLSVLWSTMNVVWNFSMSKFLFKCTFYFIYNISYNFFFSLYIYVLYN